MTNLSIEGGRALLGEEFHETSLRIAGRDISAVGSDHGHGPFGIDASGLKVLPGIVDLHGDAFERQMMPRAGVDFPVDVALVDSDRQADRQRHHHGVSRHDLVVGAGAAQRGQCTAAARGHRGAAAAIGGGHPLPPAPRNLQPRCRNRNRPMAVRRTDRSVRVQRPHGFHRRQPCQAAEAQPHGGTHRSFQRRIRRSGGERRFPRSRRPGIGRTAGRSGASGRRPHAVA